jgi:hypothetical protein
MTKTKVVLSTWLLSVVWVIGAGHAQALHAKPRATQQPIVRVVVINMSGKSREAQVGDRVVALPVAERIALQVPRGEGIKITSNTDQRIARAITVAAIDDGRTIAVD